MYGSSQVLQERLVVLQGHRYELCWPPCLLQAVLLLSLKVCSASVGCLLQVCGTD
jgi:hypothetical protein